MKFTTRATALLMALMILVSLFAIPVSAQNSTIYSGIGFVTTEGLNLRQQPDLNVPSLTKASAGDCVLVIGQEGNWYHVLYNLTEGYMSSAYLQVSVAENAELGYGTVNTANVNLRSGPDTSYASLGTASAGVQAYIIGFNRGWFKIIVDSRICYIRSDFLELNELPYENRASSNSPKYFRGGKAIAELPANLISCTSKPVASSSSGSTGSVNGSQIAAKAQEYLGTPYVYGGASPSGFDCSGFVYYVFNSFGISVGRTPDQQASAGTRVDKASLMPGDIVLFAGTNGSGFTHSGIYAGNGQFIHAPNSRSTVSYSDLTSGYWSEHFSCGVRVS